MFRPLGTAIRWLLTWFACIIALEILTAPYWVPRVWAAPSTNAALDVMDPFIPWISIGSFILSLVVYSVAGYLFRPFRRH